MRFWCLSTLIPSILMAQAPRPAPAGIHTITELDIERRVGIIADDSMMGRGNPSPGLERAAAYVAAEFRHLGLKPAGDRGTYYQRFWLTRWAVDTISSEVRLSTTGRAGAARIGKEARYVEGRISGGPIQGEVVLLAGGTSSGADLRDRIALLVLDYSRPLPPTLGQQIYQLAASGPRAVLLLSNRDSATFRERLQIAALPRLLRDSSGAEPEVAPIIELHERSMGPLLRSAGIQPEHLRRLTQPERRLVPGLTAQVRLSRQVLCQARLPNVVAVLEGTDPLLRDEYVAVTAHIDHIGVTPGLKDSINNGADDNASGVAGLLELAEAFSAPGSTPRRSLLFITPSAEEPGLLGSAHFVAHPTIPLERIVADINMDLIGRNWRDSVIAVGLDQSDLGPTLLQVARAHPELRMFPIADRWPEERIFYRSDHYHFARQGIPILFFTSGTHPDYHRPSDSADRIDAEKESRLVRLLFHLIGTVADQEARPRWNPESFRQIVERK